MSIVDDSTLVSTQWLADRLEDPDIQVFDCTVHLEADPGGRPRVVSGHADYLTTHIPGAGFLDLTSELSDTSSRLAFTLPPAADLKIALEAAGVDTRRHLVLYSSSHPMWATRVWWMLHALGAPRVAVLDGGLQGWDGAGLPLASGVEPIEPGFVQERFRPELWASREQVLARLQAGDTCTLNALPHAVYTGASQTRYGRPGHISGSVNVPYEKLFARDGQRFAPATRLREHFARSGALERPVVCYCGGGIAATVAAFVLTRLGHEQVAVYDGSQSEWAQDPALPMTEGSEPGDPGTAS